MCTCDGGRHERAWTVGLERGGPVRYRATPQTDSADQLRVTRTLPAVTACGDGVVPIQQAGVRGPLPRSDRPVPYVQCVAARARRRRVEALTAEQRDDVGSDLHADRPPGQPACDHVDLETGNLAGGRIVESVQHHGFVEAVEELRIEEALDGAPDNFLVVRRVSAAQRPTGCGGGRPVRRTRDSTSGTRSCGGTRLSAARSPAGARRGRESAAVHVGPSCRPSPPRRTGRSQVCTDRLRWRRGRTG